MILGIFINFSGGVNALCNFLFFFFPKDGMSIVNASAA